MFFVLASCSTSPKKIASSDLEDYKTYEISKNKTAINGKYVECTTKDQAVYSFHFGKGKVSRVTSTWGRAKPGSPNIAESGELDLIKENEFFLQFADSLNRRNPKECGRNYYSPGFHQIFQIARDNGSFKVEEYTINDLKFITAEREVISPGEGSGKCKVIEKSIRYGACIFMDAESDVKDFLAPYKNTL